MTAKLLVRGMTFQSQSVEGVKQALAIPLTETQALAWALPFLLVPGKGLKVERPCCIPLKSNVYNHNIVCPVPATEENFSRVKVSLCGIFFATA